MELEEVSNKELDIWPHWLSVDVCWKDLKPEDAKVPFLVAAQLF